MGTVLMGIINAVQQPKQRLRGFNEAEVFAQRTPPLSQTADLCSTITMPPMVSMLKSIAEAIINLLTLLLQILVHQLEKQEVIVESEAQNDQELHASLHEMMNQINVQRASLEALKGEIVAKKTSPKRGIPTASMSAGSSPPIEDSVAMVPTQTKNVVQRRSKAPSMTSQAPSWEEVEEIEEVFFQETVNVVPVSRGSNRGSLPAPSPPTLPLPGNLSLAEWGTNVIEFGRKHKGRTFAEVMEKDPGYLRWSLARYHSLMPEHQDFVRYGQLWEREIGQGI